MKILVACSTDWKQLASNQAIRDTWAKYVPPEWDLRFFLGSRNFTEQEEAELFTPEWIGSPGTLGNMAAPTAKKAAIGSWRDLQKDELLLDCPDGYLGLPWKTIESLKWALAEGYDGVIRCFVDTYLFPDRILARANLERYAAAGWAFGCGPCAAHPSTSHSCPLGGAAYWLDEKSIRAVIDAPVKHWGEDTHIGFALDEAGIKLIHDFRYVYDIGHSPQLNRSKFSIHLNDRGTAWDSKLMLKTHAEQEIGRTIWTQWDGYCKRDKSTLIVQHPRGPRCKLCGVFV